MWLAQKFKAIKNIPKFKILSTIKILKLTSYCRIWWKKYYVIWVFFSPLSTVSTTGTAWKISKCGAFSCPYIPVFGLNPEMQGPEKTPYLDTFHAVTRFCGDYDLHFYYHECQDFLKWLEIFQNIEKMVHPRETFWTHYKSNIRIISDLSWKLGANDLKYSCTCKPKWHVYTL